MKNITAKIKGMATRSKRSKGEKNKDAVMKQAAGVVKQVTIYSTPTCVYCDKAKAFFKEHNIQYTEKNVAGEGEAEKAAQREMAEKTDGYRGVPVIDVGGKIILGFDKEALRNALGV